MNNQPATQAVHETPPTEQYRVIRVPTPKTRDPFVNTPLLSLGLDETGEERFWIATCNCCVGCQGVMFTNRGGTACISFRQALPRSTAQPRRIAIPSGCAATSPKWCGYAWIPASMRCLRPACRRQTCFRA